MRIQFFLLGAVCFCIFNSSFCQVAITTDGSLPDPSAMLHIKSQFKGMLIPSMTLSERNGIAVPAKGLIIFQTDEESGFYYNSGTSFAAVWTKLVTNDPIANHTFVDLTTAQTVAGNKTFVSPFRTSVGVAGDDVIWGINYAAPGTANGAGIVGISSQSSALAAGVWAENPNAKGTGLVAIANGIGSSVLPEGSGISASGNITGIYARSATSGTGQALYSDQFGSIVRVNYYNGTQFKINGVGTVSTIIRDNQNNARTMFAAESPEILFTDYGHGKLINGKASIQIDPILSGTITVNDEHPLKVYIQVEGECNGVYVTNKSGTGFQVVELMNGKSTIEFSYQIVASRADEILEGRDDKGNIVKRTSKHVGQRFPIDTNYNINIRPLTGGMKRGK